MGIFEDVWRARHKIRRDRPWNPVHLDYLGDPEPDDRVRPLVTLDDLAPGYETIFGVPVDVSHYLPIRPDHRDDARRIVRHGLADVLEWLGEEVGPKPGEATHAMMTGDPYTGQPRRLYVSHEFYEALLMSRVG